MATAKPAASVTDIKDAAAARWLAKVLAPARAHVQRVPDAAAVDRIRARVLGEGAARKVARSIAA